MDEGDIVTAILLAEEKTGDLKILGKLYQPWPPCPEKARAERRRGQLYLSIVVNPDGSVSDVRITKSLDKLWTSQLWKLFARGDSKFLLEEGQLGFLSP